jgi:hypothetical protein
VASFSIAGYKHSPLNTLARDILFSDSNTFIPEIPFFSSL